MSPILQKSYESGVAPYIDGKLEFQQALDQVKAPIVDFMILQTRENDIAMFAEIARIEQIESPEQIPLRVLIPAFLTSELRSAFTIGFLIYIPFVVIDLVVASVLMSMGMMMLSPMMISMPFKLMLFVLVDGWSLIMSSLASTFAIGG
jgi:flagellar biosynthetic protein FliP